MELKFDYYSDPDNADESSNRTFMELKLSAESNESAVPLVLIVPLWN